MATYKTHRANPNSTIIRTSTTRDNKTIFLHEDGTLSNRLYTFGFTALPVEVMHRFFDAVQTIHSGDIPAAVKRAKKGILPVATGEELLSINSRMRMDKIRQELEVNREVHYGRC